MDKIPALISKKRLANLKMRMEQVTTAWSAENYESYLKFYVKILPKLMSAERCTIYITELGTEDISSKFGTGLEEKQIRPPREGSIAGQTISTGKGIIANNLEQKKGYHKLNVLIQGENGTGKKLIAHGYSPEVLHLFVEYEWPGNVRQLHSEVERLVALTPENEKISATTCSQELLAKNHGDLAERMTSLSIPDQVKQLEIRLIEEALKKTGGQQNKSSCPIRNYPPPGTSQKNETV